MAGPSHTPGVYSVIQNQTKQGIVQPVEDLESKEVVKVHYQPHHAVIRQDKETTKLRVVYDASAKSDGPSVNNCLYTGPKFDQWIMDILLRFHTHRIALTADIKKAFLVVSIAEKDRDVLRFLWIDDVTKDISQSIYVDDIISGAETEEEAYQM